MSSVMDLLTDDRLFCVWKEIIAVRSDDVIYVKRFHKYTCLNCSVDKALGIIGKKLYKFMCIKILPDDQGILIRKKAINRIQHRKKYRNYYNVSVVGFKWANKKDEEYFSKQSTEELHKLRISRDVPDLDIFRGWKKGETTEQSEGTTEQSEQEIVPFSAAKIHKLTNQVKNLLESRYVFKEKDTRFQKELDKIKCEQTKFIESQKHTEKILVLLSPRTQEKVKTKVQEEFSSFATRTKALEILREGTTSKIGEIHKFLDIIKTYVPEIAPACKICFDSAGSSLCVSGCGHPLCEKCYKRVLAGNKQCPTCRNALRQEWQVVYI